MWGAPVLLSPSVAHTHTLFHTHFDCQIYFDVSFSPCSGFTESRAQLLDMRLVRLGDVTPSRKIDTGLYAYDLQLKKKCRQTENDVR